MPTDFSLSLPLSLSMRFSFLHYVLFSRAYTFNIPCPFVVHLDESDVSEGDGFLFGLVVRLLLLPFWPTWILVKSWIMAISVDELYSPVTLFASYKFSVANFAQTHREREGREAETRATMGNGQWAIIKLLELREDPCWLVSSCLILSGCPCFRFVLTFVCHSCQNEIPLWILAHCFVQCRFVGLSRACRSVPFRSVRAAAPGCYGVPIPFAYTKLILQFLRCRLSLAGPVMGPDRDRDRQWDCGRGGGRCLS